LLAWLIGAMLSTSAVCHRSAGTGAGSVSDAGDTGSDVDTNPDTDTWPNGDTAPEGYGDVVEVCWVATFGGPEYERAGDVVSYPDGSSVVSGHFQETITFGLGEPNETTLVEDDPTYPHHSFLARFDADGMVEWVERLASNEDEGPPPILIAAYPDHGVVATGSFAGEAVFGEGEPNETVLVSEGSNDLFLARFEEDGHLIWARKENCGQSAFAHSIGVASDGSIVTMGHFNDDIVFGEGEVNETELPAMGSTRYIARYQADGALAWARIEAGMEAGSKLATFSSDSFVATGLFVHNTTFGEGDPNATVLSPDALGPDMLNAETTSGMFITSYDMDGALRWARGAGLISSGVAADGSPVALDDDSFIVAGMFGGVLAFDYSGPNETLLVSPHFEGPEGWPVFSPELFAARLDADGELVWAMASESGYGNDVVGVNASLLPTDRFLMSGKFTGAASFGLGEPADTWLVSSGDLEPFAAVYDVDGNLEWVARVGSSWEFARAKATAGLEDGTFLLAGSFSGEAGFIPVEGQPFTVTSNGPKDGFLMRVCPQPD
jgi:hypothetical protein